MGLTPPPERGKRGPAPRVVWVGIFVPAADYPPRRERVEKVFSTREKASAWVDELPPQPNRPYRTAQRMEVE